IYPLFFHCPHPPPPLPSFPTRRSSDLAHPECGHLRGHPPVLVRHLLPGPWARELGIRRRRREPDKSRNQPDDEHRVDRRHRRSRSEEHTSELQSLAYLVCRLLLEKKKR